jgi:hypothetical protein
MWGHVGRRSMADQGLIRPAIPRTAIAAPENTNCKGFDFFQCFGNRGRSASACCAAAIRLAQPTIKSPATTMAIENSRCILAIARPVANAKQPKAAKKREMLIRSDCIALSNGESPNSWRRAISSRAALGWHCSSSSVQVTVVLFAILPPGSR